MINDFPMRSGRSVSSSRFISPHYASVEEIEGTYIFEEVTDLIFCSIFREIRSQHRCVFSVSAESASIYYEKYRWGTWSSLTLTFFGNGSSPSIESFLLVSEITGSSVVGTSLATLLGTASIPPWTGAVCYECGGKRCLHAVWKPFW